MTGVNAAIANADGMEHGVRVRALHGLPQLRVHVAVVAAGGVLSEAAHMAVRRALGQRLRARSSCDLFIVERPDTPLRLASA